MDKAQAQAANLCGQTFGHPYPHANIPLTTHFTIIDSTAITTGFGNVRLNR